MSDADFDVNYVAHLARLELSPEEEAQFQSQLGSILEYVEKLKELDVSNVEAMAHPAPLENVMRADDRRPSLSNEEAMRNAPSQSGGLFVVPKILE